MAPRTSAVVGRVEESFGDLSRRPFAMPAITIISSYHYTSYWITVKQDEQP